MIIFLSRVFVVLGLYLLFPLAADFMSWFFFSATDAVLSLPSLRFNALSVLCSLQSYHLLSIEVFLALFFIAYFLFFAYWCMEDILASDMIHRIATKPNTREATCTRERSLLLYLNTVFSPSSSCALVQDPSVFLSVSYPNTWFFPFFSKPTILYNPTLLELPYAVSASYLMHEFSHVCYFDAAFRGLLEYGLTLYAIAYLSCTWSGVFQVVAGYLCYTAFVRAQEIFADLYLLQAARSQDINQEDARLRSLWESFIFLSSYECDSSYRDYAVNYMLSFFSVHPQGWMRCAIALMILSGSPSLSRCDFSWVAEPSRRKYCLLLSECFATPWLFLWILVLCYLVLHVPFLGLVWVQRRLMEWLSCFFPFDQREKSS